MENTYNLKVTLEELENIYLCTIPEEIRFDTAEPWHLEMYSDYIELNKKLLKLINKIKHG